MAAVANLVLGMNQIEIESRLYLYGSQATDGNGISIVEEIERMYNEPEVFVFTQNRRMKVIFKVSYEVISINEAILLSSKNTDFRNNFIRIESKNVLTRSFMGFGLGDNAGHWVTSDQLGISTTAAHEFGHGLGLDHPIFNDYRGTNLPPPIMAPRGSLVDPQYQWSPLAKAGEFGGTMNPIHRKVTVQEVEMVIRDLSFEQFENNLIGRISNTFFSESGNAIDRLA